MRIHSYGSRSDGKSAAAKLRTDEVRKVMRIRRNRACVPGRDNLAAHCVRESRKLSSSKPPMAGREVPMALIGLNEPRVELLKPLFWRWLLCGDLACKERQPTSFLRQCSARRSEPAGCDAARLRPVANAMANRHRSWAM